jgi:hypothetical protein
MMTLYELMTHLLSWLRTRRPTKFCTKPRLSCVPSSVRDTGHVRLGDGFLSAEFPPLLEQKGLTSNRIPL